MLTLQAKKYSDGLVTLSAENAAHPLVLEYFKSLGATINVTDQNRILIRGPMGMNDIRLGEFLQSRGVNLSDPHALDTPVPASMLVNSPPSPSRPNIPDFPNLHNRPARELPSMLPTSSTLPFGPEYDLPKLPATKNHTPHEASNVQVFNTMLLTGMLVYMAYKFIIKPIARRFNASYEAYNDYRAQPKISRHPTAGGNTLRYTEQPVSFLGWLMGSSHARVDLVASTAQETVAYEAAQAASATATPQRPKSP